MSKYLEEDYLELRLYRRRKLCLASAGDGSWLVDAYVVDGPQAKAHFSILVLAEDDLP